MGLKKKIMIGAAGLYGSFALLRMVGIQVIPGVASAAMDIVPVASLAGVGVAAFTIHKLSTMSKEEKAEVGYAYYPTMVVSGLGAAVGTLGALSPIIGIGPFASIFLKSTSAIRSVAGSALSIPATWLLYSPKTEVLKRVGGRLVKEAISPEAIASQGKGFIWSWGHEAFRGASIGPIPVEVLRIFVSLISIYMDRKAKAAVEEYNTLQDLGHAMKAPEQLSRFDLVNTVAELNLGLKLNADGKYESQRFSFLKSAKKLTKDGLEKVKDKIGEHALHQVIELEINHAVQPILDKLDTEPNKDSSAKQIAATIFTSNITRLFFGSAVFTGIASANRAIGFTGLLTKLHLGSVAGVVGSVLCSTAMSTISIGVNSVSAALSLASYYNISSITKETNVELNKLDLATSKILQTNQIQNYDAKAAFYAFGRFAQGARDENWLDALLHKLSKVENFQQHQSTYYDAVLALQDSKGSKVTQEQINTSKGRISAKDYEPEGAVKTKLETANKEIVKIKEQMGKAR